MKKLIMMTLMMCLSLISFAQTTYEKTDSVNKTKNMIYSDTKMFIAEYWKSAQNVIQNDDKNGGMILVKGIFKITQKYNFMYSCELTYGYTIKFLFKDYKYKIVIDNMFCERNLNLANNQESSGRPHPCLKCEYPGARSTGLYEKNWKELQIKLDEKFKEILNDYQIFISKPSQTNNW